MKIGAVVVTYRRPTILEVTLAAIAYQTVAPELIVVVDNDSSSGNEVRAITQKWGAIYVEAIGNIGYGAGIAIGIERARELCQPDAYWVMDDDSTPTTESLALLVPELAEGVGVVANRGGHVKLGRIRHTLGSVPPTQRAEADFTLIDGALVAADVVDQVGLPRSDLFMMLEDFEYTTRAKAAGFRLVVVGGDASEHRHLGSSGSWRGYYQSRNLLRIAIERRSLPLILGWAAREVAIGQKLLTSGQLGRLRLRLRGARDGVLGRMGRAEGLP